MRSTVTWKTSRRVFASTTPSVAKVRVLSDSVMKEHRLIVVLEKYNMSNDDIDRMLVINNQIEDLSRKEKGVKDSIELFFMLEDEDEFVENLRSAGLFKSILPTKEPKPAAK